MRHSNRVDVVVYDLPRSTSPMWKEPEKCVPMLRSLADEFVVDELCVADRNGILTHSATKDDIE